MPPFEWTASLLMTMPGVDRTAACAPLAEIGAGMSRFASSRHLASWAGLCPGNNESAGKRRSGKSHPGSRWIKGGMTEIAWAGSRTNNGADYYERLNRKDLERSLRRDVRPRPPGRSPKLTDVALSAMG